MIVLPQPSKYWDYRKIAISHDEIQKLLSRKHRICFSLPSSDFLSFGLLPVPCLCLVFPGRRPWLVWSQEEDIRGPGYQLYFHWMVINLLIFFFESTETGKRKQRPDKLPRLLRHLSMCLQKGLPWYLSLASALTRVLSMTALTRPQTQRA
jgi:pilus assembly protein TadC